MALNGDKLPVCESQLFIILMVLVLPYVKEEHSCRFVISLYTLLVVMHAVGCGA
jgi:hypothetical protein